MRPAAILIREVGVDQGTGHTGPESFVSVGEERPVPGSRVRHVPAPPEDLGPRNERRRARPIDHDVTRVEEIPVMKEDVVDTTWCSHGAGVRESVINLGSPTITPWRSSGARRPSSPAWPFGREDPLRAARAPGARHHGSRRVREPGTAAARPRPREWRWWSRSAHPVRLQSARLLRRRGALRRQGWRCVHVGPSHRRRPLPTDPSRRSECEEPGPTMTRDGRGSRDLRRSGAAGPAPLTRCRIGGAYCDLPSRGRLPGVDRRRSGQGSPIGSASKDVDIVTDALPQVVEAMFERTVAVGISFGVVIVLDGDLQIEVATFREERGIQIAAARTRSSTRRIPRSTRAAGTSAATHSSSTR